jgi:low affinity Fe/Cu permease
MIFLIEYDRRQGRLVSLIRFDESNRRSAEQARLDLELRLNAFEIKHEVVLLEAATEDALRQTHRRYFETLSELSQP